MTLEIELVDVEERTIAAVRARIAMSDIPDKIFPLMDRVWEFIRGNGIEGFGHNIWLYGTPSGGEVDVEIGVEVPEAFESTGDIACSGTPPSTSATTPSCPGSTWHSFRGAGNTATHSPGVRGRSTATGKRIRRNGARTCIT
ncbi:MAG: GyrI-like domain-containing protein [Gammaproteobacteria bacterium]|nr:GyrI-like domain-containing protein [Gammaproteobacteria bacterium]